jgi:Tfp pilus assembly protein PilF
MAEPVEESACARFEALGIVDGRSSMNVRTFVLAAVFVGLLSPAAYADRRSEAKSQVEFGIKVAQSGLWKEAQYRWERAVEIDPTYAAAWNNLAVAYEQQGQFDDARKAYDKALEIDPNNLLIRQNYDLFKEINDRTKSRDSR